MDREKCAEKGFPYRYVLIAQSFRACHPTGSTPQKPHFGGGPVRSAARRRLGQCALVVAATAAPLLSTLTVGTASAHGPTINPLSRPYSCWEQ